MENVIFFIAGIVVGLSIILLKDKLDLIIKNKGVTKSIFDLLHKYLQLDFKYKESAELNEFMNKFNGGYIKIKKLGDFIIEYNYEYIVYFTFYIHIVDSKGETIFKVKYDTNRENLDIAEKITEKELRKIIYDNSNLL